MTDPSVVNPGKASINSLDVFDKLDLSQLAVRDNGVLSLEAGSVINKRFKYFNNSGEKMDIEVISNIPSVVNVKTNQITIQKEGFDFIKFLILAPKTPCYIDAKLLITNKATQHPEELILFRLDID